jgi:hypothetical protein
VPQLPDLSRLNHAEKDALILALWAQVEALTARVAELETTRGEPAKTPDNSSLPPSKGQKPNQPEKTKRIGPRKGSLGRKGGGRPLACEPTRRSPSKPWSARIARPRWPMPISDCTTATTRSTCHRFAQWSQEWSVMPGIARAAAVSPWRRCRRAWSKAHRSA